MDLINSLNNQLFDFSEVVDANDLIRKMRAESGVFLLMVAFFYCLAVFTIVYVVGLCCAGRE